ncbi:hypothetical protein Purlil1_6004 [Purpureocillium lilacinum]|uniref:Uncharacterized protein n=1 Tax=Purpureocillium lilacinum TaxID=33203 RepID=A0ABR0C1C9_PURLI|nr:hypothetical protein Purlil1_6004 [Purpureocillium lilacinum]
MLSAPGVSTGEGPPDGGSHRCNARTWYNGARPRKRANSSADAAAGEDVNESLSKWPAIFTTVATADKIRMPGWRRTEGPKLGGCVLLGWWLKMLNVLIPANGSPDMTSADPTASVPAARRVQSLQCLLACLLACSLARLLPCICHA